jgi:hypothetical protein
MIARLIPAARAHTRATFALGKIERLGTWSEETADKQEPQNGNGIVE